MAYKKISKICTFCNHEYLGNPTSKYCSYDCSHKSRKSRKNIECLNCQKIFEVQTWNNAKYCSKNCCYKHHSSKLISINCTNCNKGFKRKEFKIGINNFCCKECANSFNTGSNHYEYKEHLHDKHISLALKQWGKQIKTRDSYTCQICGESNKLLLEAHHIKHRSNSPELMFDLENGITLCLSCHYDQHIEDPKSSRLIKYKIDNNLKLMQYG